MNEDACPLCGSLEYEVKAVLSYLSERDRVEECRKCLRCGITRFKYVPAMRWVCLDVNCKKRKQFVEDEDLKKCFRG